jgi:uncharacterized membrane protein YagU involved in acid resistance
MTPLRIAARRAGLIEKTVPQVIEEAIADRLGLGYDAGPEKHHLIDQLLHVLYGAKLGALYRLAARRARRGRVLGMGALLGTATWIFGGAVVIPLLRAARPLWRARPREELVNLAAHLVFGIATALVADELPKQPHHRPTPDRHRRLIDVG